MLSWVRSAGFLFLSLRSVLQHEILTLRDEGLKLLEKNSCFGKHCYNHFIQQQRNQNHFDTELQEYMGVMLMLLHIMQPYGISALQRGFVTLMACFFQIR
ncbi:hypothetical protein K1719_015525 [Acacia pycnantha]|nr:hypothetical protein K1719_015525 [Acacia pycnantha]